MCYDVAIRWFIVDNNPNPVCSWHKSRTTFQIRLTPRLGITKPAQFLGISDNLGVFTVGLPGQSIYYVLCAADLAPDWRGSPFD